ncbi:MAG: dihydropteroate synthase [Desulfovibrio sp.]|jgi:dihydropteroate synthase|nr:dihydropteroate synthase [Desulfovibrio sp.]
MNFIPRRLEGRKKTRLRLGGGRLLDVDAFFVAGIVNITPDSFSDGGLYAHTDAALGRVREILRQGAFFVDLGAESTRPGCADIGQAEEWRRLAPVLEAVLPLRLARDEPESPAPPSFCLCVDTFRAGTAAAALKAHENISGARVLPVDLINDISGGFLDPAMDETLAAHKPGYVLGHCPVQPSRMSGRERYPDVADALLAWFSARLETLVGKGLPEECVCLDPCIGFAKSDADALRVIEALPRFAALGRPIYLGLSRKKILGTLTGLPPEKRDAATAAACALLALDGVDIHRVHDVESCLAALKIAAAFRPRP